MEACRSHRPFINVAPVATDVPTKGVENIGIAQPCPCRLGDHSAAKGEFSLLPSVFVGGFRHSEFLQIVLPRTIRKSSERDNGRVMAVEIDGNFVCFIE